MTLGKKIERLLNEQKRTQRWLAAEVGVSPNSIFKIIGGGDTSYRIAVRIAATFGETTSWLLDDSLGWEQRSRHENSLDLAGVSDRDLFLTLDARINRIIALYANAMEELKRILPSSERIRKPRQDQVLRGVIAQGGYDGRVYLLLLYDLLKLQEYIAQLNKELRHRPSLTTGLFPDLRLTIPVILPDRSFFRRLGELVQSLSPPAPAAHKKPKPRTTGKKSAPAKPQRPKRPPRS